MCRSAALWITSVNSRSPASAWISSWVRVNEKSEVCPRLMLLYRPRERTGPFVWSVSYSSHPMLEGMSKAGSTITCLGATVTPPRRGRDAERDAKRETRLATASYLEASRGWPRSTREDSKMLSCFKRLVFFTWRLTVTSMDCPTTGSQTVNRSRKLRS